MSKASRQKVDVDMAPARAREPRFRRVRATFIALVCILVGLGLWKAYELIVIGLNMYNDHRSMVNVTVAMTVVVIIVGALWYMMRAYRTDKSSQQPVLDEKTTGAASPTSRDREEATHASTFEDSDADI